MGLSGKLLCSIIFDVRLDLGCVQTMLDSFCSDQMGVLFTLRRPSLISDMSILRIETLRSEGGFENISDHFCAPVNA